MSEHRELKPCTLDDLRRETRRLVEERYALLANQRQPRDEYNESLRQAFDAALRYESDSKVARAAYDVLMSIKSDAEECG